MDLMDEIRDNIPWFEELMKHIRRCIKLSLSPDLYEKKRSKEEFFAAVNMYKKEKGVELCDAEEKVSRIAKYLTMIYVSDFDEKFRTLISILCKVQMEFASKEKAQDAFNDAKRAGKVLYILPTMLKSYVLGELARNHRRIDMMAQYSWLYDMIREYQSYGEYERLENLFDSLITIENKE